MRPSGTFLGQSYYAGTDGLNIEGKGVTPDIWLPVTIETTLAALEDPDFVLNIDRKSVV